MSCTCVSSPGLPSKAPQTGYHRQQTCVCHRTRCWKSATEGSAGPCPSLAPGTNPPLPGPAPGGAAQPIRSVWLHAGGSLRVSVLTGLLLRTPVTGLRIPPKPVRPYLNQSHLQRPQFQIRSRPEALDLRGTPFNPRQQYFLPVKSK